MEKQKLVVVIMGQDYEKFIGMCLDSVKDADTIVYCDGGSTDDTLNITKRFRRKPHEKVGGISTIYPISIIKNEYNQEDKAMNGKQRNFYLDYVKENYPGWWCLVLDADEVVEDLSKIKNFINILPQDQHDVLWSIKMRHFIGDLGHEDATQPVHYVQHRLFKIRGELYYPEVEHPILQGSDKTLSGQIQPTTIWHLAYVPNIFDYKKKYENHVKKSNMHDKEFLKQWYRAHIFGTYPRRGIDIYDIPDSILDEFEIDRDEFYFSNKLVLEAKHVVNLKDWSSLVEDDKINIIDFGCGFGHYGYASKLLFKDAGYSGREISKWAVENTPYKDFDIKVWDVMEHKESSGEYNLVLCIDLLEHLEKERLHDALKNIKDSGKHFIFSIPFIGDPNLERDPTHRIKETKEWWVEQLSKYFVIKDAPKDWLVCEQTLVGEIK